MRHAYSFIEDAAAGNLPQSTPGALGLGVPKWTVEAAPDPAEIEWQSIGIGRIEHGFRTIGINLLTFLCVLLVRNSCITHDISQSLSLSLSLTQHACLHTLDLCTVYSLWRAVPVLSSSQRSDWSAGCRS